MHLFTIKFIECVGRYIQSCHDYFILHGQYFMRSVYPTHFPNPLNALQCPYVKRTTTLCIKQSCTYPVHTQWTVSRIINGCHSKLLHYLRCWEELVCGQIYKSWYAMEPICMSYSIATVICIMHVLQILQHWASPKWILHVLQILKSFSSRELKQQTEARHDRLMAESGWLYFLAISIRYY